MQQPPNNNPYTSPYAPPPPPVAPPPPQKPMPHQRFIGWYRRQSRPMQIIVALVLVGAVIFVGSAVVVGGIQGAQQGLATPTAATQGSQPTSAAQPTQKPTQVPPTATKAATSATSSGPDLLGSDIGTFTAHFGQPNDHSTISTGQYHYDRYPSSNIDHYIITTDTPDGGVYSQRVYFITVQATDQGPGWTMAEASRECGAFLPADAKYKQQIPVATGPALDKIYYSASLAKLFPASSFTDGKQNPVKAGMFDVQYLYKDASEKFVDSCAILIGEQQTS